METYLKLTSVKNDKACNCITPFYINNISGINPITGRSYSNEDMDIMKTALYRISAAKSCSVTTCCDPNDPNAMPDEAFTKQFKRKYPKIMPMYQGSNLLSIKLSLTKDVVESGWIDPIPYFICKITKATIQNTKNPNIQIAVNLVPDCFNDSCSSVENITVDNLLQNSKADMNYTSFDDARVYQAILEGNISYVKEYIRKYKQVDIPLTNNDYRNRMVHLAAESPVGDDILTMLISLKANLNIQNKLGETPSHFAVRGRNLNNLSNLLSQGVDLTIPNNNGESPMFYAMATGDISIVNMLYTNNSPILIIDKQGNNLIHYCILNCPSYREDDKTVPNTKSEIIQWLIDRGISTEQANTAGITPLELIGREINKEIDRECNIGIQQDKDDVIEKFFGGRSIYNSLPKSPQKQPTTTRPKLPTTTRPKLPTTTRPKLPTTTRPKSKFSNVGGAIEQNISQYTPEHLSLLDIQTKIFNNIIRNNPNKYNDYINVADIPKGAPIQVLDTVCVGGNDITGNEDSDECIAKGGQLVNVKNKTTKIKLDLIPEEETEIDQIEQSELYYKKNPARIPNGTVPSVLATYNADVRINGDSSIRAAPQMTTGITYPIAVDTDNLFDRAEKMLGLYTTPSATNVNTNSQTVSTPTRIPIPPVTTVGMIHVTEEHPSMLDENDNIIRKCRLDAIRNSEKIVKSNNANTTGTPSTTSFPGSTISNVTSSTTMSLVDSNSSSSSSGFVSFLNNYKIPLIIGGVILILFILAFVIYWNYYRTE
jgi:hypothetical protein